MRDHAPLDRARGDARRHAVEIGAGGCGRGRGVGNLRRVGRGDAHALQPDAEFLRHHLRDLDIEPLPHLGAAMVQVHGAILIDMHQRAGLVEVDEREADAELHRRERKAALHDRRGCVERRDLLRAARGNSLVCSSVAHEPVQRLDLLHLHADTA